jgi:hypothetical protein
MIDDQKNEPGTEPSTLNESDEAADFAASIVGAFAPEATAPADLPTLSAVIDLDPGLRFLPDAVAIDGDVPGPKEPDKVARFLLHLFADAGLHLKHWRDEW